ncbi:MAG: 30S ribosomal protein S6 [Clostridiales bacterium]|nr:30S ribosomal protein S6 [Clostridiales bacterium]
MNNYEVLYILSDKQDQEARTALIEKFKNLVAPYGEVSVNEWGTRKLEYAIQTKMSGKHLTGYYVLMKFVAPPELPAEIERQMRISDDVIRFMIERV